MRSPEGRSHNEVAARCASRWRSAVDCPKPSFTILDPAPLFYPNDSEPHDVWKSHKRLKLTITKIRSCRRCFKNLLLSTCPSLVKYFGMKKNSGKWSPKGFLFFSLESLLKCPHISTNLKNQTNIPNHSTANTMLM